MENKLKLYGFNNLTKSLSFNIYDVCYAKFTQDENLKSRLLATGDKELVEGNAHNDRCWGMTYDKNTKSWVGENRLGIVLMKLREDLK